MSEKAPRQRFARRSLGQQSRIAAEGSASSAPPPPDYAKCWFPRPSVVFNVLLSARISAAFLSNISDCDETYNYWDPTHFLLYGSGFQTWEYAPRFAVRSYAYVLMHALPGRLVKEFFHANKVTVFYYIRFLLAIACACCETYFYRGVAAKCGGHVARLTFALLAVSSGMFIASTAFLPSSFAMQACLVAMGAWFQGNFPLAIAGIAIGSLVGWPFCALLGAPIAYDMIVRQRRFLSFLQWSAGLFIAIMFPLIAIDSHYYGKQVVAPLNIVLYNVFGGGGPDLYGVESWTFYPRNLLLNFNVAAVMAAASLPLSVAVAYAFGSSPDFERRGAATPVWLLLSPMYIWAAVFFTRPHKEERFLFPVYPCICLSAAICLSQLQRCYHWLLSPVDTSSTSTRHYSHSSNWLAGAVLAAFTLISLSRSTALFVGYHAPLEVYQELHELVAPHSPDVQPMYREREKVNICVGKEWYRFPSSFFLPDAWSMRFVRSEFRGQLPNTFNSRFGVDATRREPVHMNDMNLEEPSRYFDEDGCDLMIDVAIPHRVSEHEPDYSNRTSEWEVIVSKPFLDAAASHPFFRAFYIPLVSARHTSFVAYNLLRRRVTKQLRSARRRAVAEEDDDDDWME